MFRIDSEDLARAYEERHGEIPSIDLLDALVDEVSGRLDNLLDEILPAILDDAKNSEVTA
jgi:hypothetical protein